MVRGAASGLAVWAASVVVATGAAAAPSTHLVYVRDPAAMTCPDETSFRQAVHRRIGYDPFFPWAKTTVVVEVRGEGQSFAAYVLLVDQKGVSRGTRELRSGPSGCQGLIDAAALAISIALDMDTLDSAKVAPAASSDASSPPIATEPAPSSVAVSTDVAPAARDEPASPSRASLRPSIGFDTFAALGAAPEAVPGFDVWAAIRRGRGWLGLELRADAPNTVSFANGGRGTVVLLAATLAPCVYAGPVFACALGSLGWLYASGSELPVTHAGRLLPSPLDLVPASSSLSAPRSRCGSAGTC
jgi:hypothetical protein